jgi:hypothetical protein
MDGKKKYLRELDNSGNIEGNSKLFLFQPEQTSFPLRWN